MPFLHAAVLDITPAFLGILAQAPGNLGITSLLAGSRCSRWQTCVHFALALKWCSKGYMTNLE
jgi:hypothetical protein